MDELNWIAKKQDSSLDASKAAGMLDEKPYDLRKALKVLGEELKVAKDIWKKLELDGMRKIIEVVYENGVFKPLEKVDLKEKTKLKITI